MNKSITEGTVLKFKATGMVACVTGFAISQRLFSREWETQIRLENPLTGLNEMVNAESVTRQIGQNVEIMEYRHELDMVIRELFQCPIEADMEEEIKEPLPFMHFGRSGGYGLLRRQLVEEIQKGHEADRECIERLYYNLIIEKVVEWMEEAEDKMAPWQAACELATHIDNL